MIERMTVARALAALQKSDEEHYGVLLEHGSLEIGFYTPKDIDRQEPHDQDEVYIIQAGTGTFVLDDVEREFEAGEALFVPAGKEHRFKDFSDDFAAWVVFFGPHGGEAGR